MIIIRWSILLHCNSVPRYSPTFSCDIFAQIIDWRNQWEVTASVLISDPGSGYDKSITHHPHIRQGESTNQILVMVCTVCIDGKK